MAMTMYIPPLVSGGIMLTYRCTNRCRHCLYRCGPRQPDAWMSEAVIDRVFDALSAEPRLAGVHLAGGEATLNLPRLEYAIRAAARHGVRLDYLETNGYWASDTDQAVATFRRLAEAGLGAVLISASPYHNEFIPFRRTRTCIEAAHRVFGPGGTIVWTTEMFRLLGELDPATTHTVEEFRNATGVDPVEFYPLTPGGRAVDALRDRFDTRPAESYADEACRGTLESVSHFHIDPQGRLFTGLCPGLSVAGVEDFHPVITFDRHPVFTTLANGGPVALMELADQRHGYQPRGDGYISKCDLCIDVRRCMLADGEYPEIGPADFYDTE